MSATTTRNTSNRAIALVARGPVSAGQWKLENVTLRPISNTEVKVRIVASGICLADIHAGDAVEDEHKKDPAIYYPRVLGHEGAGYVEEVGSLVRSVNVGDPVLLSFNSCGSCYNCKETRPAYCIETFMQNFQGTKGVFASEGNSGHDIGGLFFGQSSFASRTIAGERSVVNLASLNPTEDELRVLAPLGCGVQTGTGAFINTAEVKPGQDVAVLGVGGVGQSAIMGAALIGCQTIIAIDNKSSRLRIAKSLGATHCIDTSAESTDLVAEVLRMTGGRGVHASLDTTGVQDLARKSWDFVRCKGKVLQVGLAKPDALWNISMANHMNSGKQIIGCVQGDALPQSYALEMVKWFRQGRLPVHKIISTYPATSYEQALEDMRRGVAIKPVLLWQESISLPKI